MGTSIGANAMYVVGIYWHRDQVAGIEISKCSVTNKPSMHKMCSDAR